MFKSRFFCSHPNNIKKSSGKQVLHKFTFEVHTYVQMEIMHQLFKIWFHIKVHQDKMASHYKIDSYSTDYSGCFAKKSGLWKCYIPV